MTLYLAVVGHNQGVQQENVKKVFDTIFFVWYITDSKNYKLKIGQPILCPEQNPRNRVTQSTEAKSLKDMPVEPPKE